MTFFNGRLRRRNSRQTVERDLQPFGLNNLIGKLLERRVRLLGDRTCNCKML